MPIARTTLAFAAAILAIPAVVLAGAPIGEDGARHLLARTGFGPTAAARGAESSIKDGKNPASVLPPPVGAVSSTCSPANAASSTRRTAASRSSRFASSR